MGYPQKIVTCCYCGTRAALVLRGKDRHELACSTCGAPLHNLKMLPVERAAPRGPVAPASRGPGPIARRAPDKPRKRKPGAMKKLKLFKKFAEEAFDFIEDVFD